MLKVVLFNSPPRLGKGVAAKHMCELINTEDTFFTAHTREFKDTLFELTASMLDLEVEDFLHRYDSKNMGSPTGWHKDMKQFDINGTLCSQREALIHMSENIIKPVFGKDSFGKAMVESLPSEGIVFISDGGFPEEVQPVIDHVGEDNLLIIRIRREGVTFEGDSRQYLNEDMFPDNKVTIEDVNNDKTLGEFLLLVTFKVGAWYNKSK